MNKLYELITTLDKSRKNYAVFDCDFTIITGDVEQYTVEYQLEKKEYRVSLEHIKNKLAKYSDFKEEIENLELNNKFRELINKIYVKHREDISYLLLEGYTLNEVYELTTKALKEYEYKFSLRQEIKELFDLLKANDVEIYVCSASMINEVYVATDMYGIKRENVMAINISLDENGKYTGDEIGIATRGMGKVKAIEKLNYSYPPVIVAGDSDGDYEMLTRLNPMHGMIINPKDSMKIKYLVNNFNFFEYIV